jgi:hypothetical protein
LHEEIVALYWILDFQTDKESWKISQLNFDNCD